MNRIIKAEADCLPVGQPNTCHINAPGGLYRSRYKRLFDVSLACLLVPVLALPILLLWTLSRIENGSGFYAHRRVGRTGAAFYCWKIRTMVPDADRQLHNLLKQDAAAAAEWAISQKLRNDPRVTRFGAVLRKTSLDELPQIWNVLCGDMSFVGPRPVTESEIERFGSARWSYFRMTPGITGVWQVSGRNELTYRQRVELETSYLGKISFLFDLRILAKTLAVVVKKTGC